MGRYVGEQRYLVNFADSGSAARVAEVRADEIALAEFN